MDGNNIDASFEDGVLKITLPKLDNENFKGKKLIFNKNISIFY
ncbi:heat shock protein [Clostridium botulinum A1 str. CFSAN002368]|nr:heat shock protein [Clostridium botulinum A1 str. CFSAN002368]